MEAEMTMVWRTGRWPAVVGAVLVALGVHSSTASGAARTFTERFETNDTGDIEMVGNTLVTCPASNPKCASAQDGTATGGDLNNNAYLREYGGRFNSSSADLTLPAGATVLNAMLYLGGDSTAGTSVATRRGRARHHSVPGAEPPRLQPVPEGFSLASAPGARLRGGRICRTRRRITAGRTVRFALTVRVDRNADGRVVNTAVAQDANARARAQGRVPVQGRPAQPRGGGLTG